MGRSLDSYLDDTAGGVLGPVGPDGTELGVAKRRKFRDPKSVEEWLTNLGPRAQGKQSEEGVRGDEYEFDGNFGHRGDSARVGPGSKVYGALRNAMWWLCLTFLLPRGYPDSVAEGYAEFMVWNTLRNLFSNAFSVLGTQCMLVSLGVSKGNFSISGAWNWVLKDGFGMAAKFAVSSPISAMVDRDPKRWRVVGDVVHVLGCFLELATPVFPGYFFLLASLGNVAKRCGDAAAAPSYSVFLNALATGANIGDVSSRSQSQVVVGKIAGLLVGVLLGALVGAESKLCFAVYILLGVAHVICSARSAAVVQLRTLDEERLGCVLDMFITYSEVPTVRFVNRKQAQRPILPPRSAVMARVSMGAPLHEFWVDAERMKVTARIFSGERYMLGYRDGKCVVMLREDATGFDVVCAALEGRLLLENLPQGPVAGSTLAWRLMRGREWLQKRKSELRDQLERGGWDFERVAINVGSARYSAESMQIAEGFLAHRVA